MSMVFRFRMLSDENDNFVRDYEVPYDMTLLESISDEEDK